jgi:hypothetical protein
LVGLLMDCLFNFKLFLSFPPLQGRVSMFKRVCELG